MKMLVGAMAYFEIEVPNYSIKDYEEDNTEPIFKEFWRRYENNELGQGEMEEVEVWEVIK